MTALELFAILVLAGAVIVLLYFYLRDRGTSLSPTTSGMGTGDRMSGITEGVSGMGGKVSEGVSGMGGKVTEGVSGMGEKVTHGFSGVGDKIKGAGSKFTGNEDEEAEGGTMAGVSEKMAGMGEKIKGKVREVPISTDVLSNRIQSFLDEQSDQLIKDWDLATKSDLSQLEKRYDMVSIDLNGLEKRFNEFQGNTTKKIGKIEDRLAKLESPEEESTE